MPERLLVFAGVNLALSAFVALPMLVRHRWTSRHLVLAGVPILWALLMAGAYLYLLATMPPSSVIGFRPDGTALVRHGNVDWIIWDERVSTTTFQAFCLTVATALSEIILWLAYTIRARRRYAHFA